MRDSLSVEERVAQHYARPGLTEAILAALVAEGKDITRLSTADLAAVDEFHTGGRDATAAFASGLGLEPGMTVLDVGCGIGGTVRYLAERYGASGVGVDLTPDFIATARALSRLVGLGELTRFEVANALALPFADAAFDAACMIHVGMNVDDKPGLFAETRRVLRPGATFGIFDVMATGSVEVAYPLPCALGPETCFMGTVAEYRRDLAAAGFEVLHQNDRLDVARSYFRQERDRAAAIGGKPPPLGVHILLKERAPAVLKNVVQLFETGVLAPVEIFCRTA